METDPQIVELNLRIKALEERNSVTQKESHETAARAEEKERHAAIRSSLGDYQFASDEAREDGFRSLRDEVKRREDGELYGGDFVPLKDFIKTKMAGKSYLLKHGDGAGGRSTPGTPAVRFEDIRTGMKPEARDAAWEAVREVLKNS